MFYSDRFLYQSGSFGALILTGKKLSYFSCSTDMKHFLQKLVSQLMNCCEDVKSNEEGSVHVTQKRTHYSTDLLFDWYKTVTQKAEPKLPSKKRTSSHQWQCPPVVLVLKDMESFTTKVLQDFITVSR